MRQNYSNGNKVCDIDIMRDRLAEWEYVWNNVRPHEALDFLTPNQYLDKYFNNEKACKTTIILQAQIAQYVHEPLQYQSCTIQNEPQMKSISN